ncbi:hypothetical protein KY285_009698 [Solanum tuberosum]|nr:hypothetical protein KY285_009698 [Solanum tuberosum]
MPETSPVPEAMTHSATNKVTIYELGYLYSKERLRNTLHVTNFFEWEKGMYYSWHIRRFKNLFYC